MFCVFYDDCFADIMAKKWFDELDLDDLRQKKYEAPFKPNTATLDTLVEKSSMHALPDFKDDDFCPPPSNSVANPMFGSSSVNSGSLLDDSDE